MPDFSAVFCSRSSDPLSFRQLLPLGINTQLVWITALLTCIVSTLQHIFNYFWKLYCSFCFSYGLLLLSNYLRWHWTAFFTFIDKLQDKIHYWLLETVQEEKLHAGSWSFWDTSAFFAKGKAASIPLYSTNKEQYSGFWAASKVDSHMARVYKPSKRVKNLESHHISSVPTVY